MTIADAKAIILTAAPGATLSTDERWEHETAWLSSRMSFRGGGTILDFGCGIGRLAKEIIGKGWGPVVGVDSAHRMRALAAEYVGSDEFRAISPEEFHEGERGEFKGALAVWVLQHVRDPAFEIDCISRALAAGAPFYVVNRFHRAVPGPGGCWVDDGLNLMPLLMRDFHYEDAENLPADLGEPGGCYLVRWRRK